MSLEAVRSELITLLGTVTGVKQIYYDMPTTVEVTPSVAVMLQPGLEELDSTCTNDMDINYLFRVMVEKKDDADNDRAQTTILIQLIDDILDKLRLKTNSTLNGDSYILTFAWGEMLAGEAGSIQVWYVDIAVNAKTLKSIL